MTPRELATKRRKRWREAREAKGLCPVCGGPKAPTDSKICRGCLDHQNKVRRLASQERIAARIARGEPAHGRRGCAGFQAHPEHINRDPNIRKARRAGRLGGAISARRKAAASTLKAMQAFRELLGDVRSQFTAEQIADLEWLIGLVYRNGIERGYGSGYQRGLLVQQGKARTEAA